MTYNLISSLSTDIHKTSSCYGSLRIYGVSKDRYTSIIESVLCTGDELSMQADFYTAIEELKEFSDFTLDKKTFFDSFIDDVEIVHREYIRLYNREVNIPSIRKMYISGCTVVFYMDSYKLSNTHKRIDLLKEEIDEFRKKLSRSRIDRYKHMGFLTFKQDT